MTNIDDGLKPVDATRLVSFLRFGVPIHVQQKSSSGSPGSVHFR